MEDTSDRSFGQTVSRRALVVAHAGTLCTRGVKTAGERGKPWVPTWADERERERQKRGEKKADQRSGVFILP